MSAAELVATLTEAGVTLWEEDGRLRFRAPRGTMTPERLDALKACKDEVLAHLRKPALTPDPETRHEPFPLTDVQASYLLGRRDTFAYGGVACHGYGELVYPALDVERLETAWQSLVRRHDMLRATIGVDGVQQVLPEVPEYRIAVTDAPDFTAAVEANRAAMDHLVHDTETWPMFELRVTLGPDSAVLHFSIDFLICDFVSIQLLLGELHTLYADPDTPLPELELTFRDYQAAERALRAGPRHDRDRDYWWARLDDLPPAPELPLVDRTAAPRFRRWQAVLEPEVWQAFATRAGTRGLTPSGAVLAAYAEVIGRWARTPRFSLNITLLNRLPLHEQVNAIVGDFTSVDMLAVDADPTAPFADRARAVQEQLWRDLDHRLCSGVEVIRELTRRRGGDAALMPVVFTSAIGLGDGASDLGGELTYGISQTPQVWIDCQNIERAGGLHTNWDVREGVFPDGLVDDMFAAYEDLLRRMAAADDVWDAVCPVPLPATQATRRTHVNATTEPLPAGLLHDGVVARALSTPDAPAVLSGGFALSYGELLGRALATAETLRADGCGPGDIVGVVMDKGVEQVVGVLGVLLASAVYLPVDTVQPPERRRTILTTAKVRQVLTQSWLVSEPGWPEGVRVHAVDAIPAGMVEEVPPVPTQPDELAYVIFTSGSTGGPKGVMISHRGALNTVGDINRRFGIGPTDRVLGLANLGFDLSVWDVFGTLAVGGTLVLPDPARRGDPSHWADLVAEHGVTVWNSVPAQLQMLADYLGAVPAMTLPTLRLAMLSGDWIPVPLPDQVRARIAGLRVVSLGGATEGSIWSIWYPIGEVDPRWPSIPYGTPLTNQTFHVHGPGGRDCPDWVAGELVIGGAGVALGYLGEEELTRQRFGADPASGERRYRTGDLGRYLPDGTIEFLGRQDTQVKIRGHRIELAEVESALASHPAVGAVAVLVDGDTPMERRLAAVVEPARAAADPPVIDVEGAARDAGAEVLRGVDLAASAEYYRELDRLALLVMFDAVRGVFTGTRRAEDVVAALEVAPRHHRLVRRWLTALTDNGLLARDGDGYRLGEPVARDREWARVDRLRAATGDSDALLGYFRASAEHLPALLRGETDPIRLLFPSGGLELSATLYADALFNRWANQVGAGVVRTVVEALVAGRSDAEPLRVLEVGAGTGSLSGPVVDAVADLPVEYLFTDLSQFFLNAARERFAEYPWVRYATYDLNAGYRPQGLAPNRFDLVLAGDVVHTTRDVDATLAAVRELLVPGGWLVFVEMTRDHYQIMTSLELLMGTDGVAEHFTDLRQGRDQTFLDQDEWHVALTRAGAEVELCVPAAGVVADLGIRVFAARFKTDRARLDLADLTAHLAARLPEYMVPAHVQVVDALPLTDNGKVDRRTLHGWLPRRDTARPVRASAEAGSELEQRVCAVWAEVLKLERIGPDDDFFELGGDSLLAAQLAGKLVEQVPEMAGMFFDHVLRLMLEERTVAALCAQLDSVAPVAVSSAPAADLPVVLVEGDGVPVVLVPGRNGVLPAFDGLAGPVLGLPADPAVVRDLEPGVLVDRLAADYANLLLDKGYSAVRLVGGVLAVEVARYLTERGAEVAGLVVVPDEPGEPEQPGLAAGLDAHEVPLYFGDLTVVSSQDTAEWWRERCLGEVRTAGTLGEAVA